jgi:predicted Ser/Thr protein kinase
MFSVGPMEILLLACVGFPMLLATIVVLLAAIRYLWKPAQPKASLTAQPVLSAALSHQEVVRTRYFANPRNASRTCPRCHAALAPDAPEGLCPTCLLAGGLEGSSLPPTSSGHGSPAGAGAVDAAALAEAFPNLEIMELLGQGGMGTVFKVRQKNLDRLAALKVIPPQAALDPTFSERFSREARALARLNHSSIVTVYESGQHGHFYFLLMEYIDGPNLRQLMCSERIAPREALAIVPQICDALQYAHDQGIVHRDIKPENVLLDRTGRVKIADFGLAKLLGTNPADFTLTHTQQVMGTPRYMAPEQIEHPLEVDHRADIYSLGVVLYEMLTGELPIGRFAPPSQKVEIDVRLDEIVLRTLEKEPQRRYQQVSQVKTELASVASTPGPAFPPSLEAAPDAKRPALSPWEATAQFELAPMAAPPLGMTLTVAIGLIVGMLMIAAGVGLVVAGLYLCQTAGYDALLVLGGWGVGVLLGGAGAVFGCWNSYRKLSGAVDLVHAPHVTWFDYAMRVYLLVGVGTLVCGAMLLPTPQEEMSRLLLLYGGILTLQGIGVLVWRWAAQRHHTLGGASASLRPPFALAVIVPTLAIAAVWTMVLLDFQFMTSHWPRLDERTMSSRPSGERVVIAVSYSGREIALRALAIAAGVSTAVVFLALGLWRAVGPRQSGSSPASLRVAAPLAHPAWPLVVSGLGFAALLFPWARLNLDPAVMEPDYQAPLFSDGESPGHVFRDITRMQQGFRYSATGLNHVGGAAAAILAAAGAIAAGLATRKSLWQWQAMTALVGGILAVLAIVRLGHQMGEHDSALVVDAITRQGLAGSYEDSDPGRVRLAELRLANHITLRPAFGFYVAAGASLLLVLIGATQGAWGTGVPEQERLAERSPRQFAPPGKMPLDDDRELALAQVRAPGMGLIVSGVLGLAPIILLCVAIPLSWAVLLPVKTLETRPEPDQVIEKTGAAAMTPLPVASLVVLQPPLVLAQQGTPPQLDAMPTWIGLFGMLIVGLVFLLALPASILLIIGGVKMRQLQSYGLVKFAAIVALLPLGPQWLISLPMGIWALAVLGRSEVKSAFR